VAEWAQSPSKPMPPPITGTVQAAFADLDTVSLLALLRGLAADASVPAGTKFETFVYADRVLGLDLPRSIGRTG
jgi:cysteinyl-tRNA synthetase